MKPATTTTVIARTLSEAEGDVAISCIELRCAAVRGDSHGPYGASE